jgi:predicted  nucleic acid-binding Zn-ribbon protein
VREQIQQLYTLQQTDTRIARAKAELAEMDHGAALRKRTRVAKAEFDELEAKLRSRKTDQRDAELELKKIEGKIERNQLLVYGGKVANPKELANIEKETRSLERQRGEIDERVLLAMSDVEELAERTAAAKKETQRLAKRYKSTVAEHAQRQTELENEIEQRQAERIEQVAEVEPRHLQLYERLRLGSNNLAVVLLDGAICAGCRMQLPSLVIKAATAMQKITQCDSCRRILCAVSGGAKEADE